MTQMIATVPPSEKPQSTGKYTQKSQCNTKHLMPLQGYVRHALMIMMMMMITTTRANIDEVLSLRRSYSEHFSYIHSRSSQQD